MPSILPILLVLFAASPAALAADTIPVFNVEPTCRAAVAASPGRAVDTCLRDEADARAQLEQRWSRFPAKDRTSCTRLSLLDGHPSYVELLTCLEIAEEARSVRD